MADAPGGPAIPLVDVIIVAWNHGDTLAACLASLGAALQSGYAIDRVVVVDNASSVPVRLARMPDLPTLTLIENTSNRGFAAGSNQGAAGTRADYLLFLNPDTRV